MRKFLTSVADVYGYGENDGIVFTGKTLLDSSLEVSLGSAPVRGGRGNQLQYIYYHTGEMKFTLTDTQWNLGMLGATVGSDVNTNTNSYQEASLTLTRTTGGSMDAGVTPLAFSGSGTIYGWATTHDQTATYRVAFTAGWPYTFATLVADGRVMRVFKPKPLEDAEQPALRDEYLLLQNYFLAESRREGRAGAKIVFWPEINLMVFRSDEQAFMERARQLAREEQVYLLMGIGVHRPDEARPLENKAVLVNPAGEIAFSYVKTHPVPGIEAMASTRGDGRPPTQDTEYGRLATVVCYDMDFPPLLRYVGRARADIIMVPTSDGKDIVHLHRRLRCAIPPKSRRRFTQWTKPVTISALAKSMKNKPTIACYWGQPLLLHIRQTDWQGLKHQHVKYLEPHVVSNRNLSLCRRGCGRTVSTCEAHRSRQQFCHSRCVSLFGPPVPAPASCFLRELYGAARPPVRELL